MTVLEFQVVGHPQPGGSKRGFPIRRAGAPTGRVTVVEDNPRTKNWAAQVIAAAFDATDHHHGQLPLTGPLALQVEFTLARPAGHYGTGRNHDHLKPSAPLYPAVRPDVTKLLRPLEDALKGILWRDDAQVVTQVASKRYGHPEGAHITIRTLEAAA